MKGLLSILATGFAVLVLLAACSSDGAGPPSSQPTRTMTPAGGGAPPRPAPGKIAFISRRDGNFDIYTVEPDGGNLSRLVSDPAEQGNIAWSPDGSRLAFYSLRGERWQLDIVDADGSGLATIADGLVTGHDPIPPVWSPDGSRLAFESEHEGDMELYVVNADGTGLTNLTRNSAHDSGPSWSPDGSRIAFSSDRGGNTDIYVMNADGFGVTRLTKHPAVDTAPAWSPRGERIAFASFRDGDAEIYTVNADGSGLTNVTRNPAADFPGAAVGHRPPAWSPDGSRIAFVSDRDGNLEIYVAAADGSEVTRLTDDPADDFSPAWSPDGSWVAFVSSGDVYIVAADGSGLAPLTDAPQADGPPAWQPAAAGLGGALAGRQLAFVGSDRGVWLVNADGSGRRRLAAEPCEDAGRVADLSLAWSPDGGKLAFICSAWADGQRTLVVLDDTGERLAAINDAAFSRWAPDGERLAYQTSDYILTTAPRYEVRVLDLASREDTILAEDAWLVQWPLPARLVLGFNPHTPGFVLQYDAHWLDIETGEAQPIPRFDSSAQFWLTPDATKAVVLGGPPDRDEGGATLAVYDLQTGEESSVPGSVIGYPSESIPDWAVAISPDATKLYWADASGGLAVIYRANMDGSGLARLATVPSVLAHVTGEGLVAYLTEVVPGPIYVQNVETGARAQVGDGFWTMAWRPDSQSPLMPEER